MEYPLDELAARVVEVPDETGVYIFKADGVPVYVGKAASLRKRLSSYVNPPAGVDPKTLAMLEAADSVEVIFTRTEAEALLLEANLIARYDPKYNIALHGFPYVKVTKETYPLVAVTRETPVKNARFLGPFTDATNLRRNVYLVNRAFGLRTCHYDLDRRPPARACLDYEMGLCVAPCVGAVATTEYGELVGDAVRFILGKRTAIFRDIESRMKKASGDLRFEDAGKLRDMLQALREVARGQVAVTPKKVDRDAIVYEAADEKVYYVALRVREGQLVDRFTAVAVAPAGDPLEEFFLSHYGDESDIPPVIIVGRKIDGKESVEEYLTGLRGGPVSIEKPSRGWTARLLDTARKNLRFFVESRTLAAARRGDFDKTLEELAKACGVPGGTVGTIEMVDVSNIGPTAVVGSLVTFDGGVPDKSRYRRYRIKTVRGQDDVGAISEIVKRRFARVRSEEDEAPDLFVVDGGKGQLSAADEALAGLGFDNQPAAALAKGDPDALYVRGRSKPARVSERVLLILGRIRDEAHRFAVAYHRKMRGRRTTKSILDDVPGVGPKRKRALLRHFGSVETLARVTVDELAAVAGMNRPAAEAVFARLHGVSGEDGDE
ncbi:MAG: excinuclease ABC subunit UvrC [Candidatus Coatesbacteria bacterium]|nr:MAG: excinuclease ABC subunit UvrC [Candidatus Coatesbacteria bacterium]